MGKSVCLGLGIGAALLFGVAADAGTINWDGTVSDVLEDLGGVYTGAMVGDRFFGVHIVPDTCAAGCVTEPDPQKDETNYVFAGGTGSLSDGITLTIGEEASVNIQNDDVLDADEALIVSQLTGLNISAGEVVDVWAGASEISGGALEWEIIYVALDETLYADSTFRPEPPLRSEVDLVIFSITERDIQGTEIFSVLPEPRAGATAGAAWLALLVFGARRRQRRAR